MKRRRWNPEEKTKIVMELLKGAQISDICSNYQIHQTQVYRWRDEFLANAHKAFESNGVDKKEQRLNRQIKELKSIIGDLTVELKKTEEGSF